MPGTGADTVQASGEEKKRRLSKIVEIDGGFFGSQRGPAAISYISADKMAWQIPALAGISCADRLARRVTQTRSLRCRRDNIMYQHNFAWFLASLTLSSQRERERERELRVDVICCYTVGLTLLRRDEGAFRAPHPIIFLRVRSSGCGFNNSQIRNTICETINARKPRARARAGRSYRITNPLGYLVLGFIVQLRSHVAEFPGVKRD